MLPVALRLAACAALVSVAACGGSAPSASSPHEADAPGEARAAAPAPRAPVTSLRRAEVKDAVALGLGAFLQNVTVEDWPVMHAGKFHGFKIRTINPDWGIDLGPGDVVTRVNGIVPERPEDADQALRSLEKAASLKIEFEREGAPKTLELPIVD